MATLTVQLARLFKGSTSNTTQQLNGNSPVTKWNPFHVLVKTVGNITSSGSPVDAEIRSPAPWPGLGVDSNDGAASSLTPGQTLRGVNRDFKELL